MSIKERTSINDLLGMLIGTLGTRLSPAGVGGTTLLGPLFPCIGKVLGDDMMLGSCVLLRGGRIAVTASHVVRVQRRIKPYNVRFGDGSAAANYAVKRIHWRSGESFDAAAGLWPTVVGGYTGAMDRLAILELDPAAPVPLSGMVPYLPKGRAPRSNDILVTAGYGEDFVGNHPQPVWVGAARFDAVGAGGFATYGPRRTDLFNGMPRAGDSGAGVFHLPMSNPVLPAHLRLVGVHSGRRAAPDGEIGLYIPIDAAAEEWLKRHVAQVQPSPQPLPGPFAAPQFRHRNLIACHKFPEPPYELDGVELDLATKGADRLLVHGSKMTLKVDGKQLRMQLQHPTKGPHEVTLRRDAFGGGGHWYTNDDGNNDCYYLFLVNDGPKKGSANYVRRTPLVHIEAFQAGSLQPRPSECTIWDVSGTTRPYCPHGEEPDPWDNDSAASHGGVDVLDQDDEGNGHDPP